MKLRNISILVVGMAVTFASCKKEDKLNTDKTPKQEVPSPFNGKTEVVFNPNVTYGTMTDQDGNIYKTVKIGNQTWMAENLRTTKYNDGTPISFANTNNAWKDSTTGAYRYFFGGLTPDTVKTATHGLVYNWYTIKAGKLAPAGWHVPTVSDWEILINQLGGENIAGGKLKEAGQVHWQSPNTGATNETGFTAVPTDFIDNRGVGIMSEFVLGSWWTATNDFGDLSAFSYIMKYNNGSVQKEVHWNNYGMGVRLIKD